MAGRMVELSELEFDEERHIYKVNNEILPSVTQIMAPLTDKFYKDINKDVLSKAAERGTEVHNAIETFIKYGIEDISAENEGYFKAYKSFTEDYEVEVESSEYAIYHNTLRYAGKVDLLAKVDGVSTIVDFKTAKAVNTTLGQMQVNAYLNALFSHFAESEFFKGELQRIILQLREDGGYHVYKVKNDITQSQVFLALLTVFNYKKTI